jgi:6-phosphogluconate dehydrogenase
MKLGLIGLGKMGSRMATKLLKEGHEVSVWNRSSQPVDELRKEFPQLKSYSSIKELVDSLEKPRIVWSMLPAGDVTEDALREVSQYVQKDDIVIDGGNSRYQDTERHFENFQKIGIRFLGIGVSGGVISVTEGYPQMVGGDRSAYDYITPVLDSLAKPHGGHEYFGTGGAGHFVKMVHNGIEYPIMQAIGEGFGVMAASKYNFDLVKVAKLYQKGTLVSGFMMDRTVEALENDPQLKSIAGVIGTASGEAFWTVEEAERLGQPVESIQQAIDFRKRSETDKKVQDSFAAKMVGALRIAFGKHPVKRT